MSIIATYAIAFTYILSENKQKYSNGLVDNHRTPKLCNSLEWQAQNLWDLKEMCLHGSDFPGLLPAQSKPRPQILNKIFYIQKILEICKL